MIGDVHGEHVALSVAARTDRPLVLLGDLVDFGEDSAKALRKALRLLQRGRARLIRSNHDDKLFRYWSGNPVTVGPELARTLSQIEACRDHHFLKRTFLSAYEASPYWLHMESYFFCHGAFHPQMLDFADPRQATTRRQADKLRALSLYGEIDHTANEALPKRTYSWVNTIPSGLTVIVGHDIRDRTAPLMVKNNQKGKAIFLDTGAGKSGPLSWIDLPEHKTGSTRAKGRR